MSSLQQAFGKPLESYTLTQGYLAHIDSLRQVLYADQNTVRQVISPELGYVFKGNLTGLLLELKVDRKYHLIIMRVNGISSIHDVDETLGSLRIPSPQVMDQIMQIYKQSLNN